MKYICQLTIIFFVLLSGGCTLINDVPRHTSEEVATIARIFSSQCRVEVAQPKIG
jgi:hypothetical protein